jgi:Ca-activated chloride channel homolog
LKLFRLTVLILTFVIALGVNGSAEAEKRVALVVGNSSYPFAPLPNPENDAALMSKTLKGLGFDVITSINATQISMKKAIQKFGRKLGDAGKDGVGLFFYAGHGVQVGGANYLIPVDASIENEGDVDLYAVNARSVLSQMEYSGARLSFVVLDACRNNPFSRGFRSAARGLARMEAAKGSMIAYATAPGDVAADGKGKNSPYTTALAKMMKTPGVPVERMFREVRNRVGEMTNGRQTPWESSSLVGADFFFNPAKPPPKPVTPKTASKTADPASSPTPAVDEKTLDLAFWNSIKDSTDAANYEAYIRQYPNGAFVELARVKVGKHQKPVVAVIASKPTAATPAPAQRPAVATKSSPLGSPPSGSSRAVLVLDASGSMWGQIKGKTKIEIARNVIADLVGTIDPAMQLGLSAYGHRRKGDCGDIEQLLPVSTLDPERFVRTVNGLNPKGKTPLSEAVRQAAHVLRYTEEAATVILVSDGKETCNSDPCAIGRALEQAGVDFTAHVIGFDVPKQDEADLKCLAESTGGKYLQARDAATLNQTLASVVREVAVEKPVVIEKPTKNTRITVVAKEGSEPIERVEWVEIYPLKADGKPDGKRIAIQRYTNPNEFILRAGRYQARAGVGEAVFQMEFEIRGEDLHELTMIAGVGEARITLVPQQGAEPFEKINWVEVYPLRANGKPASKRITIGRHSNPNTFTLPAGRYQAFASVGKAETRANFEVMTEELTELTMMLGVGEARITLIAQEGAEPFEKINWVEVYPLRANGKPARKRIDIGRYVNPNTFTLPAGHYQAFASVGKGQARANFEVITDELTELTMTLGIGEARITLIAKQGAEPFEKINWVEVYPLRANGKPANKRIDIGRYVNPNTFTLPAGRYQAFASVGKGEARMDFEVITEDLTELTLTVGVGEAKITIVPKQGAAPYEKIDWVEIYPIRANGKPSSRRIDIGRYKTPYTFILPAGRYQAFASAGEKQTRQDFEVKAATFVDIEMIVPK